MGASGMRQTSTFSLLWVSEDDCSSVRWGPYISRAAAEAAVPNAWQDLLEDVHAERRAGVMAGHIEIAEHQLIRGAFRRKVSGARKRA